MSRTLWRVRPRGERPTTVAKPKENLIANCPLLNHYLGARWPSTTCRRISVLSLPQTAHSRLAVACARCFPPPCQGGTLGFAGVPPTRADPGQAVTHSPRRVRFSGGAAAAIDSHLRARRGALSRCGVTDLAEFEGSWRRSGRRCVRATTDHRALLLAVDGLTSGLGDQKQRALLQAVESSGAPRDVYRAFGTEPQPRAAWRS